MPHGVNLFNALVAPAAAFGSAVLVSVRTQYRAALGGRFGERLLLWCRETWNDEANFIFEMVALVLIPAAFCWSCYFFIDGTVRSAGPASLPVPPLACCFRCGGYQTPGDAIGITDDQQQQAEIAAALMGLPFDEVLAEVKKQSRANARATTRVIAGEQGAQRSVVVERRVVRRFGNDKRTGT